MPACYDLTPVELELMEILWRIGKGTVREVMAHLPGNRNLAYTSVSTILRILQQKNILTAEKNGRQHIYLPVFGKQTFTSHSVEKIINQIFSGSSIELVSYLMNTSNLSNEELIMIQKMLDAKKQEQV